MYAVAYLTPGGFSSVGFIGNFEGARIRVADPVFGWQIVAAEDCFSVIHTETGYVLPGVVPALGDSLTSPWLMPRSGKLAANKVIQGPWPKRHRKTLLEPELGGDKFVSGYPHAWERIQRWAFEVAPDWRSLALSAIFARCSIQRPIEEAEMLYRQFGPTLRDALLRGSPPSPEQMMRWRGIRNTRAMKREGGLDDLRSFEDIMAWAPWCAELLKSRDDLSRKVRDIIALEWLPWGIGVAKLSFTMMLSGRDAACLDTRMLNYFFGDATFDPAELEEGDDYASNARKWSEPETRLQFLSRVSSRSTAAGARGVTAGAIKTYSWLEGKLSQTPYFDPDWPQPYAKAQWMLWETLGRTAGTANHGALWEVVNPLIEEITGRPLERNAQDAGGSWKAAFFAEPGHPLERDYDEYLRAFGQDTDPNDCTCAPITFAEYRATVGSLLTNASGRGAKVRYGWEGDEFVMITDAGERVVLERRKPELPSYYLRFPGGEYGPFDSAQSARSFGDKMGGIRYRVFAFRGGSLVPIEGER